MAGEPHAGNGANLGNTMQRTMVSMVRFSGAFAFYSVENLQVAVSMKQDGGISKAVNEFSTMLDTMATSVAQSMHEGNRAIAESAARITQAVVDQSLAGFSLVDPRRMVHMAGKLMASSSQAFSGSGGDAQHQEAVEDDGPQLAVDILDQPHN